MTPVSHPLFPDVTFRPIDRDALNQCLVAWDHRMGPVRRPTGGWSHALLVDGEPVAVVATDTLIRPRVAGLSRHEAVELSRLCAARPDLSRVILRLWRAIVFPALCRECGFTWALSYQDAAIHSGNLYRFDGWTRLATSRSGTDPRTGRKGRRKVIWGWRDDRHVDAGDPHPSLGNMGAAISYRGLFDSGSPLIAPPVGGASVQNLLGQRRTRRQLSI